MRKGWHFLWILWLILGVANLLLVNVYVNHAGTESMGTMTLSLYQQLGYLGLSAVLFLLCGLWWIFVGNSKGKKGLIVFGVIVTAIFGLAIVGAVVYALAFDGKYIGVAVDKLAEWFAFLNF